MFLIFPSKGLISSTSISLNVETCATKPSILDPISKIFLGEFSKLIVTQINLE